MARSLEAALLAASVVIAGCSEAAPAPQPAVQPAPADATPPIGDRVAAALRQAAEEGTHWHRTDSVVELGRDAVPLLRTTLVDAGRESAARVLAVQSLGRIGGPDAASALHAVLAQDGVEPEVRKAAENGLFLLGEPDLVERRIESARARHADIAIARAGAEAEVAQTLYATGRFAQAAAAWRALLATSVDVDRDVDRAGRLAYDWACCAALAGAPDEALDAIAVAVKSQRTDLDWMARDGDLRTVQGDPRFAKLLADARAARTAAPARPPDAARDVPGYEEYRELHHEYWDVAFDRWIEAQNRYWQDYDAWLAAEKRTRSDESGGAYRELHGAEPEKPHAQFVPRFRALLARHRIDPIGAKIRDNLLTIFANEQMHEDWIALYTEAMHTPGQESVVGENARSAAWMGSLAKRWPELEARLRAWLAAHPEGEPAAQVRGALADTLRGDADAAAARAAYEEIVRLHPGTTQAEEATGEIYELDHLAVGMSAPDVEAKDLRGAAVSLRALRGSVVVLDFWATWCGPCIGEVPHMIELHRRFQGEGLALVGVSLDEDGLALADFLAERDMPWPEICDLGGFDGALPKLFHVRGIPDTVLVGRDGRILARGLRGEDLEKAVEKALAAGR